MNSFEIDGKKVRLDKRTAMNLRGVHPDLIRVFLTARQLTVGLRPIVTEGLRDMDTQRRMVKARASRTLNSRHLTGHAIDVAFIVGRTARWDWPLFRDFAVTMKAVAEEYDVAVDWGGDWESLRDGPHFQLAWAEYPVSNYNGAK